MPTDDLDLGYALRLEPKLAVDYLQSKGYNITWNWQEQLEAAHARAFTVAKATKAEVLETLRLSVDNAIKNGISERDFIKQLQPELERLGWWGKKKIIDERGKEQTIQLGSPHRLKRILRTNKITAYHAGRYAEQMANADEQPYWQYVAVSDSRTRASHLALNMKIYRYDDPIWQTMYPPNDWGCRCRVRALSEFRMQEYGLKPSRSEGLIKEDWALAGVDPTTGEETHAKVTSIKTDKGTMTTGAGWNYNVGQAAVGTDVAVIRKLLQVQNRELRQQTIQAINNSEARHQAFADWVKTHLGKRGASSRYISAGLVTTEIAEKVAELSGQEKASELVLVMTEKRLEHANSQKHHDNKIGLSLDEYASISKIIANPSLVIWDTEHDNLIYLDETQTIKVVVDAPNNDKLKPSEKLDSVINAYRVTIDDIKAGINGGVFKIVRGKIN
ncbi:phage head morphogenesis protein [Histophilus somni]|uniref:Phage head morphogenesis protein n=1 Tax=Histophilus somni TaxID=731 RepID=A0AAX2S4Y5_HISSO|nr:phage minor head protein [Histophilus somni]TEW31400.1 phage head morphogenesis protein [Histophilus somni]THA97448.1 phage head morphogenesis protein [Histophilus somni]